MRSIVLGGVLMVGTLVLGGCGEPPAEEGTEATSQDLLASLPQGQERSAGAVPLQRPNIDVALLGFDHGARTAPVRVVEMSDYGCRYCQEFHVETWPMIRDKFVEPGKVEWKFLPFTVGMFPNSPSALRTAECALEQGPELFLDVDRRLWADQGAWKGSGDPDPLLRGWAEEAGADMGRFDSCLAENRRGERIGASNALARQLGIRGTPTFFIVGYQPIQGALPAEDFERVLDLVYADATQRGRDD